MNYKGTIILESLKSDKIIKKLNIIKKENWNVTNNNKFQPDSWTAIFFENSDENILHVIDSIKNNLRDYWYVDIRDEEKIYIIFPQKIFSYSANEIDKKNEIIKYGLKIGIPKNQLDWQ